ncbi:MAG: PA14 domain-containing protein, partial [Chloroflexota bacterium]
MQKWFLLLGLLAASMTAVTVHADGVANWRVEYYNNQYLIGEEAVATSVSAVSFDWGSGSPASGVDADNFSARFTTRTDFTAGTYRFFARADDEVRVTVDQQTLINTFDRVQVGETVSGDIALSSGSHQIQVDYRERSGDAYVFVTWENAATNPTVPAFAPITATSTTDVDLGPWLTQYFPNPSLSGFPGGIFSEPAVSNNWGDGSPFASIPADNFSVRWSSAAVLEAGRYRVTARADDGVRVFIDGDTVIDAWIGDVSELKTADVTLSAGQHSFVVEYYEEGGEAFIDFAF